jgi:hypothetical protein
MWPAFHLRRSALSVLLIALAATSLAACQTTGRLEEPATRYPAAGRIVAIGDVHGDLDATRRALKLAGAIDDEDRWIGGNLVLVQTGDQLDRGGDERAILHLFHRLAREAAAAGGAVHALNGNHELMNAHLDLRYITEDGFLDFADVATSDMVASDPVLAAYPPEQRGRVAAFRPGGPYAMMLAERNTIVMVGDNVFVHGGVLPEHARYGIERINRETRAWLRGFGSPPASTRGANSPIWTRLYSSDVDDAACASLEVALAMLGARRMVVGHSVHRQGITSYCDGRVWAIDVGMAAYYRGSPQVLEIRGDSLRTIRE